MITNYLFNKLEKKEKKPPSNNCLSSLPKKVGIIYSEVKRKYFPTESQYLTEKDAYSDAKVIASYLKKINIKTRLFPGNALLTQKLRQYKPDLVINLVCSVKGYEWMASTIPAVLELLEIPYTGADMLGESLVYNKFLIKKLLQQNGLPVPNYQLFNTPFDPLDPTLRFPLISKLNEIHGAVEITKDSISENERHLRQRIKQLIQTYSQPILVEEYIVGREITAILFEGLNKKVYLAEKIFHKSVGKYKFASFELQWLTNDKVITYQKYNDPLLREYVKKAFEITRMSDYGKFDIRLDSSGRYFFLDCNTNPHFGPKEIDSPIAYILDVYKISFMDVLKRLLLNTIRDAQGKNLLPITNGENK